MLPLPIVSCRVRVTNVQGFFCFCLDYVGVCHVLFSVFVSLSYIQ